MEQDDRDIDTFLESLSSERSFDDFLDGKVKKEQVKQLCADKPASQLKVTLTSPTQPTNPNQQEVRRGIFVDKALVESIGKAHTPANVVEGSIPNTSKIVIPDAVESGSFTSAVAVAAHGTRLEVKGPFPIIGRYLAEEQIEFALDEEAQQVYIGRYDETISDALSRDPMEALKVAIDFIHKLDRSMFLAIRAQQGTRRAIEDVLHKLNYAQKLEYDKLDDEARKKYLVKKARKEKAIAEGKTEGTGTTKKAKPVVDQMTKRLKMLVKMGYDKEGVIETFKNTGKYDEAAKAAIEKLFAK